jgi:hypothetical protein
LVLEAQFPRTKSSGRETGYSHPSRADVNAVGFNHISDIQSVSKINLQ